MNLLLANLPNLGKFLVGFYFVFYGFWNVYHWTPLISAMNKDNVPHPYLLLPIGILWQSLCGFLIMINLHAKLAAALLIPFVCLAIIIFNPYWRYKGELRILNLEGFASNLLLGLASLFLIIGPLNSFADLLF